MRVPGRKEYNAQNNDRTTQQERKENDAEKKAGETRLKEDRIMGDFHCQKNYLFLYLFIFLFNWKERWMNYDS